MAVTATPSVPKPDKMRERVLEKLGVIPNLLKVDVTKIGSFSHRVNVWVRVEGGELGCIKTGRISDSFIAQEGDCGLEFVANNGTVR